jgi:hypothetical protein
MGIRILYRVGERMLGIEEALLEGQPWQIFVEYDNGLQVWVNLHPTENWPANLPQSPSWADFSVLVDGKRKDGVGKVDARFYLLPGNG